MPTETRVRRAAYCAVCTMPVEFCEFGADYAVCKKWFAANWKQVLPDEEAKAYLGLEPGGEVSPDELVALMTKLGLEGELDDHAKRAQKSGKKTAADVPEPAAVGAGDGFAAGSEGDGAEQGAEGAAAGGGGGVKKKKGKEASKMVVIELTTRNKRKHITIVKGLESYPEIDMAAAAKGFGKKFACGSAFQKGKNGQADQIEIQGDALEALPAFIADKHKVPLEEIFVVVEGKKVCATEL
mmetsp:Transcript_2643/g.7655  ORF Transcript_2643/g.7655 Transcript_2643/m.7655 type:complete len:240 (-) Transcript_2643:144-863(-)